SRDHLGALAVRHELHNLSASWGHDVVHAALLSWETSTQPSPSPAATRCFGTQQPGSPGIGPSSGVDHSLRSLANRRRFAQASSVFSTCLALGRPATAPIRRS